MNIEITREDALSPAAALGARFPKNFQWGVGTAAYQVEGSLGAGGRGPSIWDEFLTRPGATVDGSTAEPAADHFRRWEEDIALLKELGVNSYRFSIAWPRIAPDGRTPNNVEGIAFYDRIVDALCAADITPVATLFHWDLPAGLQPAGGWLSRDTSAYFGEYARVMGEALADRVKDWFTVVEPYIMARHSHVLGEHAPGRSLATAKALPVVHHQLLAHAEATAALRSVTDLRIGLTNHPAPTRPATDRPEDIEANALYDAVRNHMVPDAVLLGSYPEALERLPGVEFSWIQDGDLERISAPIDMLGFTYYHTQLVQAPTTPTNEPFEFVRLDDVEFTTMDWPIVPSGFRLVIDEMVQRYGDALPPLVITENGCSMPDEITADGEVLDGGRIAFLDAYLDALASAVEAGVRIDGYFYWSFLDHFEWDLGYTKRWGLVHVDFETQQRTVKSSGAWFRGVVDGWQEATGA
ncbi:beta-glucosidase [Microbacteriaceae bacterium VKM Ac-2855]|nr:beta-glucosidase [Microbacteriaceae bacterium VKM Ac-2855]